MEYASFLVLCFAILRPTHLASFRSKNAENITHYRTGKNYVFLLADKIPKPTEDGNLTQNLLNSGEML